MPDTPPKKTRSEKLESHDKVVWTTIHGTPAKDWRRLLRDEGGTEASHIRAALERYIEYKGYTSKPNSQ